MEKRKSESDRMAEAYGKPQAPVVNRATRRAMEREMKKRMKRQRKAAFEAQRKAQSAAAQQP